MQVGPERNCQLYEVFAQMITLIEKGDICIFGGGLNLCNKEIKFVGIPDGIAS